MSYDQRPGRLRVVQEADGPQRRRDDAPPAEAAQELDAAEGGDAAAPAASGGLSLVQAGLFLLACMLGGAAIAFFRPFGLG